MTIAVQDAGRTEECVSPVRAALGGRPSLRIATGGEKGGQGGPPVQGV